jgi:flagellar biogenesis protein FliO
MEYNDEQYIDIYKIVLKSMYEVEKKWLDVGVKRVEQLHDFLMQLKAKEAEENKKAGDIDIWLEKVLSTLQ